MVGFDGAPGGIGLTIGIVRHAGLIASSARAIRDAQQSGNLAEMQRQAEGLVNLIEGEGGSDYGDLDGNGKVANPGDGFGLLPNSRTVGYIQASIEHARYAAGSAGATTHMIQQADSLEIAAQNLGGWAAQLREAGLAIIRSADMAAAKEPTARLVDLAVLFVDGQDVNSNGQIEPLPNEGGTQTVYFYARRMADMLVSHGITASGDS